MEEKVVDRGGGVQVPENRDLWCGAHVRAREA